MRSFIAIDKNGRVCTFQGDFPFLEREIRKIGVRRISHVVPENVFLRAVFMILRKLFSDNHPVAAWTRKWKCSWLVIMEEPRKKVYGPFCDRKKAIEFERELFISTLMQ